MSDYSNKNKRIAKNTSLLYARSIILLVIGLYTSRVNLYSLGVSDFGVYNLVGGFVAMFSILYTSMSSASQRFITYALGEDNMGKLRNVFRTSISLHLCIGIVATILIEIIGLYFLYNGLNIPRDRLSTAEWVLHFSAITTFINVISVPYDSLIIAHEKMSAFAYISLYDAIGKLIIAWMISFYSHDRLLVFSMLLMLLAVSRRILYTLYSRKHFEESRKIHFIIDRKLFKEMFSFAGWNLFGNGSLLLRNQGVDILLNIYFGVIVNAAKGIANQIQQAVALFVSSFQTAVMPQLTASIAQKDFNRTYVLVEQGSRYSFYLLSLLTVPLLVSMEDVMNLWLREVPEWAVIFARLTLIYMMMDVFSRFMIQSVLATGEIRTYQIIVGSTKLFAVPLTFIVIKYGGNPTTGIYVNIILEFICFIERLAYINKKLHFPALHYCVSIVLKNWLLVCVIIAISFSYKYYVNIHWLCDILVSEIIVISFLFLFGLNTGERNKLLVVCRKMIKRS